MTGLLVSTITGIVYLLQSVFPLDLIPFHPLSRPSGTAFTGTSLLALLIVLGITVAVLVLGIRRRYLWVGWLAYLVILAPVLGLIQVGRQASADRYTYLALIGPSMLFAAGLVALQRKLEKREGGAKCWRYKPVLAIVCAALLALAFTSRKQIAIWSDPVTLWEHVVARYPDVSQTIHTNLGNAYMNVHEAKRALHEYDRALKLPPLHPYPLDGKGRALLALEHPNEAITAFKQATELDPQYANAWRNLWVAYRQQGRPEDAYHAVKKAIEARPDFAAGHADLGVSLGDLGRLEEAEASLRKAICLEPHNPRFFVNLAVTLERQEKINKALECYRQAVQLEPGMIQAHKGLYTLYRKLGDHDAARRHSRAIEELGVKQKDAHIQPKNSTY